MEWTNDSPGKSARLHMISKGDVIAPDIELPFSESEYAAEYVPCVNPDAHIHVEACPFPHEPATSTMLDNTLLKTTHFPSVFQKSQMNIRKSKWGAI